MILAHRDAQNSCLHRPNNSILIALRLRKRSKALHKASASRRAADASDLLRSAVSAQAKPRRLCRPAPGGSVAIAARAERIARASLPPRLRHGRRIRGGGWSATSTLVSHAHGKPIHHRTSSPLLPPRTAKMKVAALRCALPHQPYLSARSTPTLIRSALARSSNRSTPGRRLPISSLAIVTRCTPTMSASCCCVSPRPSRRRLSVSGFHGMRPIVA